MSMIYFTRKQDRAEFVKKIISDNKDEINGKVLLKVNLVSHNLYPTTTHPDMLEAVYDNIKDLADEIIVGDGHGVDLMSKKIENHPILNKCEELGIPFINFYEHGFKKIKSDRGFSLRVSEIPFKQDYIISLPILKDHFILKLTNALKDKFGYLTRGERLKMHSHVKNIHKSITELNAVIKSHLIIIDAIKVMIKAQEFRHGGYEKDLGYLFAGKDPVALDFYGFELLKPISYRLKDIEKPTDIKYIKYALDYDLGSKDFTLKEI
ncbi:MAG: DUF362 domain-containing protein [Candidatus Lokiarchaeota archaeon]|nr:DUF362 domain-containing protein [Candidatus Lokiarchaeota archaeon]